MISETDSKRRICYIIAFLLPLMITIVALISMGITPFGSKALIKWDLEIQYIDYFGWLHSVLHGEGSIAYSFSKSLGGATIGLYAYYLASPVNLLVYFFDLEHLTEFVTLAISLKIALSGLTSYIYLSHRFQKKKMAYLLLSTSYALMEYVVAYSSNMMFLDGVIMLPLVALGVYKLLYQKKPAVLLFSVAGTILFNWYTGYMVCAFSVMLLFFELLIQKKKFKENVKAFVSYGVTMLLGLGTSAMLFMPAILAQMKGKSDFSFEKLIPAVRTSLSSVLSSLYIQSETNVSSNPVIYTGGFVLVLCLALFFHKKAPKRIRVCYGIFLAVGVGCFCLTTTDIVLSCCRVVGSYFFRYSFLLSFLFVMLAGQSLEYFGDKGSDDKNDRMAIGMPVILLIVGTFLLEIKTKEKGILAVILILFLAYGLCYLGYLHAQKKSVRYLCLGLIFVGLSGELFFNTKEQFATYPIPEKTVSSYYKETSDILDTLDLKDGERLEKTFSKLTLWREGGIPPTSEGMSLGYRGITHYSSTFNTALADLGRRMGYTKGAVAPTELTYNEPVLFSDSLFGMRYVLTDKKLSSLVYQEKKTTSKNYYAYENPYALSTGFLVSERARDFKPRTDVFENHRKTAKLLLGEDVELYKDADITLEKTKNSLVWTAKATADGPFYMYMNCSHPEKELYVNGEYRQLYFNRFYRNLVYIGDYKAGQTVTIELHGDQDDTFEHNVLIKTLNMPVFEKMIDTFKSQSWDLKTFEDGKVEASITTDQRRLLMTTVPYDEDWTVRVNGKSVGTKSVVNGMMAFHVPEGKSTITMTYRLGGQKKGIAITIVSLLVFFIWQYVQRRKNRECMINTDEEDVNDAKNKKICDMIITFIKSEAFRYLFIGGCTTLVNLIVFSVLTYGTVLGKSDWGITVSNVISIVISILFAYVTNKMFVFRSKTDSFMTLLFEMGKFLGARLATLVIEVGGVWLAVSVIGQDKMIGKLETQVLVVIGNYFISKFLVFTNHKEEAE